MIRVVIADPHPIYPETLSHMLSAQAGISVTAFCSVNSLLPGMISQLQPDVLLLDPSIKHHPEDDIIKKIRKIADCKIICLSMHSHPAYAKKMFCYGVDGFVTKDAPIEELVQAIQEVLKGNQYTCKETATLLADADMDPILPATEESAAVPSEPVVMKGKKEGGWLFRLLRPGLGLKHAG